MLQRAKWALDQGELDTLKDWAAFFGLDKTKDFEEFKNKYLQSHDAVGGIEKAPGTFKRTIVKELEFDIINSGARITNLFSKEADDFADMYYNEIHSFSTDVRRIAENLEKQESDKKRSKIICSKMIHYWIRILEKSESSILTARLHKAGSALCLGRI